MIVYFNKVIIAGLVAVRWLGHGVNLINYLLLNIDQIITIAFSNPPTVTINFMFRRNHGLGFLASLARNHK